MNTAVPPAVSESDSRKLLDPELEFLWEDRASSGNAYDLYLGRISRNPVIRSQATGKYVMLPWSRIIDLAVMRGVDET